MEYIEFKEFFKENIVNYLPKKFHVLTLEIEESIDRIKKEEIDHAVLKYQNTVLCSVNLKILYTKKNKVIAQNGLQAFLVELAEEMSNSLEEAIARYEVSLPQEIKENHIICSREGQVYDVRCEQIRDTVNNMELIHELATKEDSDLYIVPYCGQLIVLAEKAVKEAGLDVEIVLSEVREQLINDIDHFGSYVLRYDKEKRSLEKVKGE